jgi:hypothetical protein
MRKTLIAMSQATIFSDNSQCKWCFYEINDLHCPVGTSHKLVFRVWRHYEKGLLLTLIKQETILVYLLCPEESTREGRRFWSLYPYGRNRNHLSVRKKARDRVTLQSRDCCNLRSLFENCFTLIGIFSPINDQYILQIFALWLADCRFLPR